MTKPTDPVRITTARPSSQSDEGAPPTPLQEQPSVAQSSEVRSTCAEAFEALQRVERLLVRIGRYDEAAAVATARCDYRDALAYGWGLSEPVGTDANCPPVFGTGTRLAAGGLEARPSQSEGTRGGKQR